MFAYCKNNPICSGDPQGESSTDILDSLIVSPGISLGLDLVRFISSVYDVVTYFHYEVREQRNQPYPSYAEVTSDASPWTQLLPEQSIYHDNGIGAPEEKFIHPDGREAVFDGDTHEPVTDPQYMATYNFVPVYNMPKKPTLHDFVKYGASCGGHFLFDMLPYYVWGNTRTQ